MLKSSCEHVLRYARLSRDTLHIQGKGAPDRTFSSASASLHLGPTPAQCRNGCLPVVGRNALLARQVHGQGKAWHSMEPGTFLTATRSRSQSPDARQPERHHLSTKRVPQRIDRIESKNCKAVNAAAEHSANSLSSRQQIGNADFDSRGFDVIAFRCLAVSPFAQNAHAAMAVNGIGQNFRFPHRRRE